MLTKSKGEDVEEKEDEEELEKEEESVRKKGKVIITKPPKPSTAMFMRSKKKAGKEGSDVIFNRPPPTFQERIKLLREGVGVHNFKALKYEIRTLVEKKEVEDLVIHKMGKWKYSLDQLAS